MRPRPRSNGHNSATSSVASARSGRSVNSARISAAGFRQPSALRRVTLSRRAARARRMHSSTSATNASPGTRYTGFVATAPMPARSAAQHRPDLIGRARSRRCSTSTRSARAERLPERVEQPSTEVDAAQSGRTRQGATGARPDRDEPTGVRAHLHRVDPGVAALTQHVSVGDQPAQVRVAGVVGREQHHVRVTRVEQRSRARIDTLRGSAIPPSARPTNRAAP